MERNIICIASPQSVDKSTLISLPMFRKLAGNFKRFGRISAGTKISDRETENLKLALMGFRGEVFSKRVSPAAGGKKDNANGWLYSFLSSFITVHSGYKLCFVVSERSALGYSVRLKFWEKKIFDKTAFKYYIK